MILLMLAVTSCSKKNGSGSSPSESTSSRASETTAAKRSGEAEKGWLEIKNADLHGHEVRKSETGEKVEQITSLRSAVELPAGIYDLTFGKAVWKNVEVKAKETTVLAPGALVVNHAALGGHDVVEVENSVVHGKVSTLNNNITLIPGKYAVMFGKLAWPVEIKSGETTTLDPGTVEVVRAHYLGHKIYDKTGTVVGEVSNIMSSIPLPPGEYVIEIGGKKISFALKEGEDQKFEDKDEK